MCVVEGCSSNLNCFYANWFGWEYGINCSEYHLWLGWWFLMMYLGGVLAAEKKKGKKEKKKAALWCDKWREEGHAGATEPIVKA